MKTNPPRHSVKLQNTKSRQSSLHKWAGIALIIGAISANSFIGTKACADTVTDYNFDSLTLGQTLPTTYPGVDPLPQHTVYAVGGFPDAGGPHDEGPELLQGDPGLTGSVTVQNVGTMSH